MPKNFFSFELLVRLLHQENYIYKIMYKQTLHFQNTGHLSKHSLQIDCVFFISVPTLLCFWNPVCIQQLIKILWVLICIAAAHELNCFSLAGLKQNESLRDKVSYCSNVSRWTMESNEPIPRQPGRVAAFCPVYIIPAK